MRKNMILVIFVFALCIVSGCFGGNDIKVYEGTEEIDVTHIEEEITGVVTNIDLEENNITFMECANGVTRELIYHGGVSVKNTYDEDIGLSEVPVGGVVDVVYYSDTNKIVSMNISDKVTVLKQADKFSVDLENLKVKQKGTSYSMYQHALAFDDGEKIDIREVSTEDQVTMYLYGGKLVSVTVDIGHGYVKLTNQDTYIGGMVEIGYDVIVPVTSDMLLAVREGEYTLRINKDGYSNTKTVVVKKDRETTVDIADIAIPRGTATFHITPADAKLYVNGNALDVHAYTNVYGKYGIEIKADGYETFRGTFRINKPVKEFNIELIAIDDEDDDDEEDDNEKDDDKTTTSSQSTTGESTTESSTSEVNTDTDADEETTEAEATDNNININTPIGVSVYLDGDYVGVSPISLPKVVGTHTITLYKKGYIIKSYTIEATDNGKDDDYNFADLVSLSNILDE